MGTRVQVKKPSPHANKKRRNATRNVSPWPKRSMTPSGSLSGQRNGISQGSTAFKEASTPSSRKWPAYNKKRSARKRRGNKCSAPTKLQRLQRKLPRRKTSWKPAYKSKQRVLPKGRMHAGQKKQHSRKHMSRRKWLQQQHRPGTLQRYRLWSQYPTGTRAAQKKEYSAE